ncbi:MAG: S24/S26 family peptidase [Candidatus Binataceae bacterium]
MVEDSQTRVRLISELLVDTLRISGKTRLRVFGTSMLPAVWPGDEVALDGAMLIPAVGEIVMFSRHGRLFIHRVVERRTCNGETELVTRGDALAECDPPIKLDQVLGRVIAIRRHGRPVPLNPKCPSVSMRMVGRAVRAGSRLRRAILKLHTIRARTYA